MIKQYFQKSSLNSIQKKSNLEEAKIVSTSLSRDLNILLIADDISIAEIKYFKDKVKDSHRKIKISLLFMREDSDNGIEKYESILVDDLFLLNKNDLNWYQKPKEIFFHRLLAKKFDLSISFIEKESYTLLYTIARIKSYFKIGKYFNNETNKYFDFMVDVSKYHEKCTYVDEINNFFSI